MAERAPLVTEAVRTMEGLKPVGYRPLVPTFSPHTGDATAAIRLAWRVTSIATAVLLTLAIGTPLAGLWYVGSSMEAQDAQMTAIDGVVFVRHQGSRDWVMAEPESAVAPGDFVRTASNARAFLQLFNGSTALLYPSSTLRILRAEQGRFRPAHGAVVLELSEGRARVGVAPPRDPAAAFFQVRMPNTEVHLEEGSYSIDVLRQTSQVRVRMGEATAHTPMGVAAARAGQRVVVRPETAPLGQQPARQDLVENGHFVQREGALPAGWSVRDLSEQDPPGAVSLTELPGAVRFQRYGRGHGETAISQPLEVNLWDFDRVTLEADVRVLEHSLSGGGWQGFEYPLMLRVVYRDATGGLREWFRGFYLHNDERFLVRDGVMLGSTDWHHVEIDLLAQVPRPWRIQRVEVVASGWDYTSAISQIHVWAE
jgi:hypothetical protein